MLTTFASGGWAAQGTPSDGPKDIADAANKIYAGGYQFTSDAADEGIVQTLDVAEGADLLVIAWMHSDADGQPALVLYDTDNAAELGRVESGAAGTYDDPDTPWRAEITTEAPAGCTHVEVRAINLAASGTVYVHQVLALPNLLSNPSFEAAGAGGADIWAGWSEFAGDGALADEAALMRSGAHAAKVTTGATIVSARARATQNVTTLAQRRYRYGAFGRGDGTNLPIVGVVDITNGL